jgi:hypothetical protein
LFLVLMCKYCGRCVSVVSSLRPHSGHCTVLTANLNVTLLAHKFHKNLSVGLYVPLSSLQVCTCHCSACRFVRAIVQPAGLYVPLFSLQVCTCHCSVCRFVRAIVQPAGLYVPLFSLQVCLRMMNRTGSCSWT